MEYMFFHCESLTQLDLGKFNTEKLTNMSTMFSDCASLQYLDLSHFDTGKVTDIQRMFDHCNNLQELNLSNFDLGSLSGKSTYIFESCDKLERIYVPCNLGITIPLYEVYGDTDKWNMNGKEITELPKKLKQSVMIAKGQKQPETAHIAAIKKHTVYECGDEFDIDDLEVQYYGTDGSVEYVTNYITDKDDIDMSKPGNQELHITYRDGDLDLMAVIRLTIREAADSYIASGTSNDIKWEIDRNGKLTITGSGDYDKGKRAPWYNYRSRIETADVKVSGMTDTSGMFTNCVNLTVIDISGLESKSITNMQGMFAGCSSLLSLDMGGLDFAGIKENESDLFSGCTKLTYLRTGINVSKNIKLPGHEKGDKWYDEKGTEYVTFPTGTDHGISLYRNGYPGDKVTKKRVFYDMREHGIQIPYTEVNMGDKLTAPAEPTDVCNTFGGWFKDEYYKNAWDFDNDIVTADIILYAKWIDNQPEDKDDSPYREAERIDLNEVFATVSKIKDKVYDGKPYEPSVKVTITENGKKITLTEGIDYRIIYKDNINVGNNCRMVIKGSGIYGGEMTAWYSINPKPVKKLKVITGNMTVGDTSDLPVYVYDGTKLLKEGVDYRLSYDDKIAERESTEAEVVITAKGNYIGMLTTKITVYEGDASNIINPANVLLSAETAEYTGRAIKNIPTVKIGDVVLRVNKDYKVQYQNNKDAGTATVTVIGKGAYKGKVVKSFEIIPAKTAVLAVNPISNKTYNGKFQKPLVTVKDGRKKLVKNKDYIIYYSDNLHAGTATVIIKGKGNYAGTDTTATFEIKPQKISKASVKGKKGSLTVMYGKENLKEGVDYKKPVYNVADIKKNKVKVTITGKGDFMGSVTKTVKMR